MFEWIPCTTPFACCCPPPDDGSTARVHIIDGGADVSRSHHNSPDHHETISSPPATRNIPTGPDSPNSGLIKETLLNHDGELRSREDGSPLEHSTHQYLSNDPPELKTRETQHGSEHLHSENQHSDGHPVREDIKKRNDANSNLIHQEEHEVFDDEFPDMEQAMYEWEMYMEEEAQNHQMKVHSVNSEILHDVNGESNILSNDHETSKKLGNLIEENDLGSAASTQPTL